MERSELVQVPIGRHQWRGSAKDGAQRADNRGVKAPGHVGEDETQSTGGLSLALPPLGREGGCRGASWCSEVWRFWSQYLRSLMLRIKIRIQEGHTVVSPNLCSSPSYIAHTPDLDGY